jgi:hypothetical protein
MSTHIKTKTNSRVSSITEIGSKIDLLELNEQERQKFRTYKPRTALGNKLWELRQKILASGAPLLNWNELEQEIAERKGDRERGGNDEMELRINLGYEQILNIVRQLPLHEKQRLTREIEQELVLEETTSQESNNLTEFQELLLHGPVMSDEQFEQFQELRKRFQVWIGN